MTLNLSLPWGVPVHLSIITTRASFHLHSYSGLDEQKYSVTLITDHNGMWSGRREREKKLRSDLEDPVRWAEEFDFMLKAKGVLQNHSDKWPGD